MPPHVYGTKEACQLHDDAGVGVFEKGVHALALEQDQVMHITWGEGRLLGRGDDSKVGPDTLVHLKAGWSGRVEVSEPLHYAYMRCHGGPAEKTPVLRDVKSVPAEKDWGVIPTMLEGESRTSGIVLSRETDGRAESGIWICTPGTWACHVTRDELCHFLLGKCTYTADSGEVFEVKPDTVAFFPQDWRGTCQVHSTVRKVYVIR
jgi:uncharacterized protein